MKSIDNFINEKLTLNKQSKMGWSLEDAQDGDIITNIDEDIKYIYIFKCIEPEKDLNNMPVIRAYAYYNCKAEYFTIMPLKDYYLFKISEYKSNKIHCYLSTDEDKQILFNAMEDNGYEWDSIKKEIKKI